MPTLSQSLPSKNQGWAPELLFKEGLKLDTHVKRGPPATTMKIDGKTLRGLFLVEPSFESWHLLAAIKADLIWTSAALLLIKIEPPTSPSFLNYIVKGLGRNWAISGSALPSSARPAGGLLLPLELPHDVGKFELKSVAFLQKLERKKHRDQQRQEVELLVDTGLGQFG